jgi:hypothetical protein
MTVCKKCCARAAIGYVAWRRKKRDGFAPPHERQPMMTAQHYPAYRIDGDPS